MFKYNFSPNKCIIWNNRCIQYKSNLSSIKVGMQMIVLDNFYNLNGNVLAYIKFLDNFGFTVKPKRICCRI